MGPVLGPGWGCFQAQHHRRRGIHSNRAEERCPLPRESKQDLSFCPSGIPGAWFPLDPHGAESGRGLTFHQDHLSSLMRLLPSSLALLASSLSLRRPRTQMLGPDRLGLKILEEKPEAS